MPYEYSDQYDYEWTGGYDDSLPVQQATDAGFVAEENYSDATGIYTPLQIFYPLPPPSSVIIRVMPIKGDKPVKKDGKRRTIRIRLKPIATPTGA